MIKYVLYINSNSDSSIKYILGGYVISVLWGWFVVPLGVASISLYQAAGITLFVNVVLGQRSINEEEVTDKLEWALKSILAVIVIPLFALTIGYLIICMGG